MSITTEAVPVRLIPPTETEIDPVTAGSVGELLRARPAAESLSKAGEASAIATKESAALPIRNVAFVRAIVVSAPAAVNVAKPESA